MPSLDSLRQDVTLVLPLCSFDMQAHRDQVDFQEAVIASYGTLIRECRKETPKNEARSAEEHSRTSRLGEGGLEANAVRPRSQRQSVGEHCRRPTRASSLT